MDDIVLPYQWHPRPHQVPFFQYMLNGGKRAVCVWHRRAGKDASTLNLTSVMAHQRIGSYWHMLPEVKQGRKVIWEAIDGYGRRVIDQVFPPSIRRPGTEGKLEDEMLIRLRCGSTWQVLGSDNYDSYVGSNPVGVVFSEYSIANPKAWDFVRPILAENGGWAIFIYTPRGMNHGHTLYEMAKNDPDWLCQSLTVDNTKREDGSAVIPYDVIQSERRAGMPEEMVQQEFYCSFTSSNIGSYYGRLLDDADRQGRITENLYDSSMKVHTAWDLGFDDDTTIWFFQTLQDGTIHLIDCYDGSGQEIQDYAAIIHSKGYNYGQHWLPHDAKPKTLAANGRSIIQQLWAEGVKGQIVPRLSVQDGIQAVRYMLPRCKFDKVKCAPGLKALKAYERKWNDEKNMFDDKPLHNWSSHYSDAFRYLALVAKEPPKEQPKVSTVKSIHSATLDDWWNANKPQSRIGRI